MNQMRDNFGVGVRSELVAEGLEPRADLVVVLDDAVVHHRDAAADVRMGVALGGHAVRGPARVADAGAADQVLLVGEFLELGDPAAGAKALQIAIDDGNPGGVVPAVLQAPQPFEENRDDVAPRYRGDDSAHAGRAWKNDSAAAVRMAAG